MSTNISIKADIQIDLEHKQNYTLPSSLEGHLHPETFDDIMRSINDIAEHIGLEVGDERVKRDRFTACKCCRDPFFRIITAMSLMVFCFVGAFIGLFFGFVDDSNGAVYFGYACCAGFAIGLILLISMRCNCQRVERRDLCLEELRLKLRVINKRSQRQLAVRIYPPTLEIELKVDQVRFEKDFLYVPNGSDPMREPTRYQCHNIALDADSEQIASAEHDGAGPLETAQGGEGQAVHDVEPEGAGATYM